MACPVHGADLVHARRRGRGKPKSTMYSAALRIAERLEPATARAFLSAVREIQRGINMFDLQAAVRTGQVGAIDAVLARGGSLETLLLEERELEILFRRVYTSTGQASMSILNRTFDRSLRFNHLSPRAVFYARTQAAELVRDVSRAQREVIRVILSGSTRAGMTTNQTANLLANTIGIAPNHAKAPLNLAKELQDGVVNKGRRMARADILEMTRRIREGTVTEAFIAKMQKRYAESLRKYRAISIARTENMRAAMGGLHDGWRQAMRAGVLPQDIRRHAIVTLDDRLRATHAQVPLLNQDGVRMDENFETPMGSLYAPPWETRCRCGVGLSFPGRPGLL